MAELVAKSVAAVAIDENLTTLNDWVNIEQVSGFTVQVENAGGGSANDITDVQIDTSDDGGVTADLDQHAGVPAVPRRFVGRADLHGSGPQGPAWAVRH